MERHEEFAIKAASVDLVDMAYTLAVRRYHMPYRAFTIWDGTGFLPTPTGQQHVEAPASPPSLTLIFSGQGAQWPQMASDLLMSDAQFRDDLCRMDSVLQRLTNAPAWSIIGQSSCPLDTSQGLGSSSLLDSVWLTLGLDELMRPAETSRVGIAELSQPLTAAVQMALFNTLARAGIKPASVVGQSSGEIAAAYACGGLSMEAAVVVAYYRGLVTRNKSHDGAMAAVDLGSDATREYLYEGGLEIACENGPASTTVSGDRDKVLDFIERVKADRPDASVRLLKIDMAYHSRTYTT